MITITSQRGKIKLWYIILSVRLRMTSQEDVRECVSNTPHFLRGIPCRERNHGWDLEKTNLQGVCRSDLHAVCYPSAYAAHNTRCESHLKEMLPFMANEMAFMNSVVFGTSSKRVTPKNFSSIPEPSRMTSTTSTSSSTKHVSIPRLTDTALYKLACDKSVQSRAPKQDTRTSRPTPRRCIVPTMSARCLCLRTRHSPSRWGPRKLLLVPQCTDSRDRDCACEILARDALRERRRLQVRVLDSVVDTLHQRCKALARWHLPRRV